MFYLDELYVLVAPILWILLSYFIIKSYDHLDIVHFGLRGLSRFLKRVCLVKKTSYIYNIKKLSPISNMKNHNNPTFLALSIK